MAVDLKRAAAKLKHAKARNTSPSRQTADDDSIKRARRNDDEESGGLVDAIIGIAHKLKRDD